MEDYRARIFGREDIEDRVGVDYLITTTNLNIRSGPGSHHEKLEGISPLPCGTRLEMLGEEGRWVRVFVRDPINGEMDIEGWVYGIFVEPT